MGAGQPGFCKICDSKHAEGINLMIQQGRNAGQVLRVLREMDPSFTFSRPTFYIHRDHVTHPLVTMQKQALANPVVVPKTNRGALEAIRDIAVKKAIDDPSKVTIDHGLKALSILEGSKRPVENMWIVLAKLMTQPDDSGEVIVGEYSEVPEEV